MISWLKIYYAECTKKSFHPVVVYETALIPFLKTGHIPAKVNTTQQHQWVEITLNNARYQHCFLVTTFAKSLGIHLLFLPPYSPNLNVIERLWKFTKKEILNAQYYDTPQKFHQAINTFFQNINQNHDTVLQKLLTLSFQFFNKNIAYSYAA